MLFTEHPYFKAAHDTLSVLTDLVESGASREDIVAHLYVQDSLYTLIEQNIAADRDVTAYAAWAIIDGWVILSDNEEVSLFKHLAEKGSGDAYWAMIRDHATDYARSTEPRSDAIEGYIAALEFSPNSPLTWAANVRHEMRAEA